MASGAEFRTDLYRGTAPYYDRFRRPYPAALLEDLRRRLPVSGTGRLLDLACGTGQVALPLAPYFSEVVALDQEQESVDFGRAKAEALEMTGVRWLAADAETVTLEGPFELITIGNAYHRLERARLAERMHSWLGPGGGVALVWGDGPSRGDRPWQQALARLLGEWTARAGAADRVPAEWLAAIDADPHEQVLRRAGFDYLGKFEFRTAQSWTLDEIAGYVYSTSFLNLTVLGDRRTEFERDLASRLLPCQADGTFEESASCAYELACIRDGAARPAGCPAGLAVRDGRVRQVG